MKGELPEGWELATLGSLEKNGEITFQNGFACGINNQEGRGIPQLRPMNVNQSGRIVLDSLKFIETDRNVCNYYVKQNDVIFNNTNSAELVGKTAAWDGELENCVLSNHMTIIRVINPSRIDPIYLARYLHNLWGKNYFKNICQEHINQASVSLEGLREVEIPYPPLPIQRQIVAVLEQIETVNRQRQAADALTRALLHSIFYEMFGDLGRNVRDYPIKPLKELCLNITDGKHGDCKNLENSGYYFISAKDIIEGRIEYSNSRQITKEDYLEVNKRLKFEIGDIVITNSGSIGKIAIADDVEKTPRTTFQKSVAIIKPNTQLVNLKYLATILDLNKQELMKQSSGSSQKNLLLRDINEFMIPLPPLAIQQQFARFVQEIERIREQQGKSKIEIVHLFKGLMEGAFCGIYV